MQGEVKNREYDKQLENVRGEKKCMQNLTRDRPVSSVSSSPSVPFVSRDTSIYNRSRSDNRANPSDDVHHISRSYTNSPTLVCRMAPLISGRLTYLCMQERMVRRTTIKARDNNERHELPDGWDAEKVNMVFSARIREARTMKDD
jgi:hypothetical protein